MSFLNFWAFWIAAAVVPALLILYFLKLRRRREIVPSTLLWKRAVQDLQVNAPFQRLRKNLLLFLQLLILAAGIFALARPIVETTARNEKRLVILIDRSASMNTVERDGPRLELAKEQAIRLVRTLNRTGSRWFRFGGAAALTEVMVVAFADRASVLSPFTTNTSDLVEIIRGIEATDGQTNIREALDLAEAYLAPPTMTTDQTPVPAEAPAKLILISDGGVADLANLVLRHGMMELIKIGATRDNVAITALRTQRNYERPELLNVILQARNYGPEPIGTDLALYVDGQLAKVRPLSLAGGRAAGPEVGRAPGDVPLAAEGSTASWSFEFALDRAATIEARLSRDDALAADNRAFAVVPSPRKLRVLLVSAGNFFLESVLSGLPLEQVVYWTPQQYESASNADLESDGQSRFDVVIFDKHGTARLPAGNYLFIGAVPQTGDVRVAEKIEQQGSTALMWWDETHPVLRYVALEYVYIGDRLVLEAPEGAENLIEGSRGAVLLRYAKNGRHYMILTFAIEHSTWWSKPSFPVFVYNTIRYLGSGGAVGSLGPLRPGDTLRVPLRAGAETATLIRPDQQKVVLRAEAGRTAYYGGTSRVGVYRVEPGVEGRDLFAVNLEDEWESDIAPRGDLKIGATAIQEGSAIKTATPEIWRWFVGVALVIALVEWYIYNRRVMI